MIIFSVALRSRTCSIVVWHYAPAHDTLFGVALCSRTCYIISVALRSRTWLYLVVWHYAPAHDYFI